MTKVFRPYRILLFLPLLISVAFSGCSGGKKNSYPALKGASDYLTIDEALHALKSPEAAAKYILFPDTSKELPQPFRPPFTPVGPHKLFDNLYFVGTTAVGAFIIDSGDGLIMLDTGCSDTDAAMMAADIKKLGLDPSKIKLIFLSHEHFDHYGGLSYFKKNVCPDARVAMSLTAWNILQTVPPQWPYNGLRPQAVDIFLTDGMKIKLGKAFIQVIATPGHSPGCFSFIFPVTDNGKVHMAGLMGGSAIWPTITETIQYKSSVEYFKAYALEAGCDVGLAFHSQDSDFASLNNRKPGDSNPLVIGTTGFDTIYLKKFRDRYEQMLTSGNLK